MNSLDPRVKRLPASSPTHEPKKLLDQFATFEVFVRPKEGKPFQHEGIVHAPNLEMAFVLAKEAFTRRFTCVSLCVVETANVHVSPLTEGNMNAYDCLVTQPGEDGPITPYEIFHLAKRGKQHVHAGSVEARGPVDAMIRARQLFNNGKTIFNIWAIARADFRFTTPEEEDLWLTLPEKKFRDASEYKGGEKLNAFLQKRN